MDIPTFKTFVASIAETRTFGGVHCPQHLTELRARRKHIAALIPKYEGELAALRSSEAPKEDPDLIPWASMADEIEVQVNYLTYYLLSLREADIIPEDLRSELIKQTGQMLESKITAWEFYKSLNTTRPPYDPESQRQMNIASLTKALSSYRDDLALLDDEIERLEGIQAALEKVLGKMEDVMWAPDCGGIGRG